MPRFQYVTPAGSQPVLGPYSPALVSGSMVFVSGQIPRDSSGKIIGDSIEGATKQALENLNAVLKAAGCSPSDVVKTTVFLQDLNDFDGMNKTYAAFFGEHRPARSTVQVAKLPANSRIEIECIAVKS
ncbi:MAG TPA: Rid family detoxifying hydrolase [Planctomycetota bacterium]|nr:Rid family detoxifying hydrolase [Planctomycetota bacterium]